MIASPLVLFKSGPNGRFAHPPILLDDSLSIYNQCINGYVEILYYKHDSVYHLSDSDITLFKNDKNIELRLIF